MRERLTYSFDSSSLIDLFARNFYPREVFVKLWREFDAIVGGGRIYSVHEVFRELELWDNSLRNWADAHKRLFLDPTHQEIGYMREMFRQYPHYKGLVKQNVRRAADPLLIAQAKQRNYCLVTQERFKEGAPCIPVVCKHEGIQCVNLGEFMQMERWKF